MDTNIRTSNKKCKLRTIEENLVLCNQQQLPTLFNILHSPQIKRSLEQISKNALDYDHILKRYEESFDYSELSSDEAIHFLYLTVKLRSVLHEIHSFTKTTNDEKAA